jgi:hypothetical protein
LSKTVAERVLLGGFSVFVVIMGFLLVPSFVRTEVPAYLPTTPNDSAPPAGPSGVVIDTVTIDAGSEERWRFFDFERGVVGDPPDTAGWDLAFKRFHVIPSGGMINLGLAAFDSVTTVPDSGYVATAFGRDTVNAVTARWYRYSFFSHLLSPLGDAYAIRTRTGRYAKMEIISYYCPGPTPGCLTFRYVFRPDGGRDLGGDR